MSFVSIVIIAVVGIVIVGFLFDLLRGKPAPQEETPPLPLAHEAGPTQTGRYRVQQMLARTAKNIPEENGEEEITENEEEQLPDPFGNNSPDPLRGEESPGEKTASAAQKINPQKS